ncbi:MULTISPECIES: sensor histidine kinase [unclassified Sphingobium]|uniref:sensor histidine kinase n=1 Tax=unclassified Sphingobium TaxID=2611147 RepID=UPI002224D4B1|nr:MULTISPECIES: sensor histidine kinase [unclassified Sphingobium]MCW2384681.1 signal transduction histidine kinase/ligand-binding sensor domain-containing protein [Sphingobium sp. B2D3D]
MPREHEPPAELIEVPPKCGFRETTLSGRSPVAQRRVNAGHPRLHPAPLGIMPAVLRLCVLILLSTLSVAALAVNSDETPGQFTHTSWTSKDGVPGMVQALAQTPDGFLWLGTYEGLFRFDGVSFDRIPVAKGHPPGSIPVSALLVTRAGELWVGYAGGAGVEVLRRGQLERGGMPGAPGEVTGLVEDTDGAIWVVGGRGRKALKRYAKGKWQSINAQWGVPDDEAVSAVLPARDGTVWLATQTQVFFLRHGSKRFEATRLMITNGAGLAQDRAGRIWLSDALGTKVLPDFLRGAKAPANSPPKGTDRTARRISLLFDRHGDLWGSTYTDGVFRIDRPTASTAQAPAYFRSPDGLSSNEAVALLEDREGNIWVATEMGLDQFRRSNIERIPLLTSGAAEGFMLVADDRGDMYFANGSRLWRAVPNEEPRFLLDLNEDIQALCRVRGGIWVAQKGHASRIEDGRITAKVSWPDGKSVSSCGENREGRFWLARPAGNLLYRDGNGWRQVDLPSRRTPLDIFFDWRGAVVGSLSRKSVIVYDGPRTIKLSPEDLGVAGITSVFGNAKGLLVGGGTGLARWDGRRIQRISISDQPWLRGVRGVVQTEAGDTWLINNKGIARVTTADLDRAFDRPAAPIEHDLFDEQDGFTSRTQNSQSLQMAMGGDDRLWFLTRQGILRIDPARLERNRIVPSLAVRSVTADGTLYPLSGNIRLPAGTRNISIQYTALSLAIPSRVRFRYRLQGFDGDWIDPGQRRQAFYTNLAPGTYTFDVIAANNEGVWNRKGLSFRITVPPTFLQSREFIGLCIVIGLLSLWLLYRLRLHTIAQRLRVRLSERLAERERVAREVHDTLLQSIQALILKFQLAVDDIPADLPVHRTLENTIDLAEEVLSQGRNRVRDLRITESGDDLGRMLDDIVQRLVFPSTTAVRVTTVGEPVSLNLIAADEIARIANEAIFNIWRHAQASQVDVRILFSQTKLTVSFKDDGVGIPEDILEAGYRAGHYGLRGMRERAGRLEADLDLSSSNGAGTELILTIPAKVAYARPPRRWFQFRASRGEAVD